MAGLTYALLAIVPLTTWYLFVRLKQWRFEKFRHIPHAFPNTAFGHLKVLDQTFKKLGGTNRHVDYVIEDMVNANGRPEILFLDLRPVMYCMTAICSHNVAEQISRPSKVQPYSVTKSPTMQMLMGRLIGKNSMITEEGESWKALRKRFNPGFAPQHIQSLVSKILEKTTIFTARLDRLAESGEEFEMDKLCTDLTFDVIGKVVADLDFNSQDGSRGSDIVRYFRALGSTFTLNGQFAIWLNFPVLIKRWYCAYRADAAIKKCIKEKFADIKAAQHQETKGTKDRSVLALALRDTDVLTEEILQNTTDQMMTFLFAGHDTTSILLQRLFYALSLDPKRLATIRAEHDAIFGDSDPHEVFLTRPDETIKGLTYTSACIKEALRLWPPAGTARMARPGTGFNVRLENGEEVCLDGTVLYVCHYLIQRDPKVYGETATDFIPERWLGNEEGEQTEPNKVPISAWRPFERGPRNCMGQELANLEARVILACVMRKFDFIKVGAGEVERDEKGQPILNEKGVYKTKSEMYNISIITAKPFDKCRMRVKFHEPSP